MAPLLEIRDLATVFPTEAGLARAVDDVNLKVEKGSVLGIVGESGCGKSITALSILRLVPAPGKIVRGEIIFEGTNLLTLKEQQMQSIRGNRIALIPQDPMTSLNPVYTIGAQIMEAIELHQKVSRKEARQRAIEVLNKVRIPEAASRINDYPHQFSGGMRQRVMIAMALSCEPKLLIADEPTTALDVTVQAQILELLRQIQKEQGMSIILITHDLGVVAEMCDMVAVMYAGSVVESAAVHQLFNDPMHPYTTGLLNSIPRPGSIRLTPIEDSHQIWCACLRDVVSPIDALWWKNVQGSPYQYWKKKARAFRSLRCGRKPDGEGKPEPCFSNITAVRHHKFTTNFQQLENIRHLRFKENILCDYQPEYRRPNR